NLATLSGASVAALTMYTPLPASGASATTNYIATASTALTSAESVNALLIIGDNITISGAALSVGAGGVASSAGTTVGNTMSAPVALGAQEGIVATNNGTLTLS